MHSSDPLVHPADAIRRVYGYVAYRIGHGASAEDVTSETMLRAVRYRERFNPRRGNGLAWLLGIARTCLADHFARAAEAGREARDEAGNVDLEADVVRRVSVATAVSRLDERDRELVALRYGADLTTAQISAVLGLSPNAVDVALTRCRTRLRAAMEQEGIGGRAPLALRTQPAGHDG
jgi:RNA polymerase sigma-70 factor (ECF subfamily)